MDGFRSLILWLAMATLVGCHYRDPSIDLLERELRQREDQVYLLEGELHRRCQQLDSCRQQQACTCGECDSTGSPMPAQVFKTDSSLAQPKYEPIPTPPSSGAMTAEPSYEIVQPPPAYEERPTVEMPTPESLQPLPADDPVPEEPRFDPVPAPSEYEILEPRIEIPTEGSSTLNPVPASAEPQPVPAELPEGSRPLLEDRSGGGAAGDDAAPLNFSFRSVTEESAAEADGALDAHVTHVVANAELVIERGFDDEVTDADILVVVEPRNKNGQYVELTGPLSVVVLDGNKLGSEARLARWDFDAGSARRLIRSSQMGRGIHLDLEWPNGQPESDNLQMFVRYTTVENRRLEADLALQPNPDRPAAGGWRVVDRLDASTSGFSQQTGWQSETTPVTSPSTPAMSGFTLQPIQLNAPEPASPDESPTLAAPVPELAMPELATPEWSPYR